MLGVAAVAALGGLAIAGCGGSDSSSTSSSPATSGASGSAAGGASTVNVSETDFKLTPSDPTVNAGKVTINASNDGQTTHSIEVEAPSGDQEMESDLAPGQSGTLTVDLPKPGKYEFYCPIDNHKQMGMAGEITVK
jgi:plastocyanin